MPRTRLLDSRGSHHALTRSSPEKSAGWACLTYRRRNVGCDSSGRMGHGRVMDRRSFLRTAGVVGSGLVAGGAASGCSSSRQRARRQKDTTSSSVLKPGPPDWQTLAGSLRGTLLQPGDAGYPQLGTCTTRCTRRTRRPLRNVRRQATSNGASPSPGTTTCSWRLARVATATAATQRVPAWSSTSHTAGHFDKTWDRRWARDSHSGGRRHVVQCLQPARLAGSAPARRIVPHGRYCRPRSRRGNRCLLSAYGLTCDQMTSVEIVTADGVIRRCGPGRDEDLYWASRGGGGGNFGIVTSFAFQVHPIPESITLFTLEWPWAAAASVLDSWLRWIPSTPDELWANCQLYSSGSVGSGLVKVTGVFAGPVQACSAALRPLTAAVGQAATYQFVGPEEYLTATMIEAGCEGDSLAQCAAPVQSPFVAKSSYVGGPFRNNPSTGSCPPCRACRPRCRERAEASCSTVTAG